MRRSDEWSTRTFGNEDRLPRVPLPTLEESCERFLEWCAPLLTADELAATEADGGARSCAPDGPAARAARGARALRRHATACTAGSTRSGRTRYLGRRDRIALNANFFFLFHDADRRARSTGPPGSIAGGRRLQAAARRRAHPAGRPAGPAAVDGAEQVPVLHHPHPRRRCRTPCARRTPTSGPARRRAGTSWCSTAATRSGMDVLGPDGRAARARRPGRRAAGGHEGRRRPGRADDRRSGTSPPRPGPSGRPSRAGAARLRPGQRRRARDDRDRAVLRVPGGLRARATPSQACDQLLHGDSGNRWFDKARVARSCSPTAGPGINVEHCELDGTTILSFVDTLLGTPAEEHAARAGAASQGLPPSTPVEFVLDDDAAGRRRGRPAESFADYAAATATTTAVASRTSAATGPSSCGISPDAFVQMAYQLAHQRAKGLIGATYESIATRQYRHGRTEAMRVVTPEVAARSWPRWTTRRGPRPTRRGGVPGGGRRARARGPRSARPAQAPEQHLWELQLIQQRRGAELGVTEPLALYDSPGWLIMRDDYLSTSSAPSVNIQYFGFGSTSDQLHRRRLRAAARPLQHLPEHAARRWPPRCTTFAEQLTRGRARSCGTLLA